jgi:hypothetical protein
MKKGVAGERLTAAGFGEEQPVAENTTASRRAQNRGVVSKIVGGTGAVQTKEQSAGSDTLEQEKPAPTPKP